MRRSAHPDSFESMCKVFRKLQAEFATTLALAQQHHHLEGYRIVKISQIKADCMLNLFQTIDQRVAMDIQLAGGFR